MIMGSEAGLTFGDYSEPLMDSRLRPQQARKQIATLSPREVLFGRVKKETELLVSSFLGNFFNLNICSFSAEKYKDPFIYNLWILVIPTFVLIVYVVFLLSFQAFELAVT